MRPLRSPALSLTALISISFVLSGVLIPSLTKPAAAETRLLGTTRLSLLFNDTDVIDVKSCNPLVTRIQLRAKNSDAQINRLRLRFKNGQTEEIDIRRNLQKDQSTSWYDLPGSARCVDKISITGSTPWGSSSNNSAKIEFIGDVKSNELPPIAIPAGTRLLGETRLAFGKNDLDILRIESCNPRVSRIRLRVRNADANIKFLALRFKNGQTAELDVRSTLRQNQATSWINLPGSERCVDGIGIVGNTIRDTGSSQARIQFLGDISSNNDIPISSVDQPRKLGETKLSIFANDTDVVNVNGCNPPIRSLQLRAKNSDANIKSLVVRFRNGQTQELNIRSTVRRDEVTRWIDLPGSERCLTQIRILGDTGFNFQFSSARVEFWGK